MMHRGPFTFETILYKDRSAFIQLKDEERFDRINQAS